MGNCNIRRRWEDLSDSDEQESATFITPQPAVVSRTRPAVYFIGDPEDDDELVFAHVEVATQTVQALAENVGLPHPDIQQMLIDSQNLTIQRFFSDPAGRPLFEPSG